MKAFLDEASPSVDGSLAYIVVATVVVESDDDVVVSVLEGIFQDFNRRNPFHWHKEGVEARSRMVSALVDLGAIAHVVVHHPTGRKKQEKARSEALQVVLPKLVHEGVDELVIESRSNEQDAIDRQTLLEYNKSRDEKLLNYSWDSKVRPELWMPDAVCGIVSNYLNGSESRWYEVLRENKVLGDLCYIKQT